MKNPCIGCDNYGDYKDETCKFCGLRINYVRQIGGFPDSREMTVMEEQDKQTALSAPAPVTGVEKSAAPPEQTTNVKIQQKQCRVCNEEKPLSEFWKNHMCKDGHEGTCKACKTKKQKERKQAAKTAKAMSKKSKTAPVETSRSPTISVYEDFADIDRLVADIQSIAAREYRTPDAQMVYFLRRAVDRYYTENPKI